MAGCDAPREMLMGYATGSLTPGMALLVQAHLEASDVNAPIVGDLQAAAGALFAETAAEEMGAGALEDVLARLDDEAPAPRRLLDAGPLPRCVIDAAGADFERLSWRFRLPGVSECELAGFGPEKVSLLRARPGCGIPQHTHAGQEATLVLTGALEDNGAVYRAGEIALADEDHEHTPRIVGEEVCHCLVVLTGPLRFTGRFSRALNYLAE